MNQVVDHSANTTAQYFLKARVHDLPEGHFRGYVEVTVRLGKEMRDSRLRHSPLIRSTWNEAIEDAERLARSLRDSEEFQDGEHFLFSSRGASDFDALMRMFSTPVRSR
jgi:hypothetical protein